VPPLGPITLMKTGTWTCGSVQLTKGAAYAGQAYETDPLGVATREQCPALHALSLVGARGGPAQADRGVPII
jgi:hypothetical protein